MSQRESGYARIERDNYETPGWVTRALMPHMSKYSARIWEPACGSGKMVRAFKTKGYIVVKYTDIDTASNFLLWDEAPEFSNVIVTNPPYKLAQKFIEHALRLMEPCQGSVGMLLRADYDHAKCRHHLFRDCPAFAKKLVLTKRIAWFVEADGKPKASPSFNHSWFLWSWKHEGPATIAYGP